MKKPTPLTHEQIRQSAYRCDEGQEDKEYMLAFARAIEAAVNAQWVEMLAGQEPVATLYSDGYWIPKKTEKGRLFNEQLGARKDVYTNPQPDDTALLEQALVVLEKSHCTARYEQDCGVCNAYAALETRLK